VTRNEENKMKEYATLNHNIEWTSGRP